MNTLRRIGILASVVAVLSVPVFPAGAAGKRGGDAKEGMSRHQLQKNFKDRREQKPRQAPKRQPPKPAPPATAALPTVFKKVLVGEIGAVEDEAKKAEGSSAVALSFTASAASTIAQASDACFEGSPKPTLKPAYSARVKSLLANADIAFRQKLENKSPTGFAGTIELKSGWALPGRAKLDAIRTLGTGTVRKAGDSTKIRLIALAKETTKDAEGKETETAHRFDGTLQGVLVPNEEGDRVDPISGDAPAGTMDGSLTAYLNIGNGGDLGDDDPVCYIRISFVGAKAAVRARNKEATGGGETPAPADPTAPDPEPSKSGPAGDADGDGVKDDKDECANTPQGAEVDEKGCPKAAPPAEPAPSEEREAPPAKAPPLADPAKAKTDAGAAAAKATSTKPSGGCRASGSSAWLVLLLTFPALLGRRLRFAAKRA
jgi:hypothetical protein